MERDDFASFYAAHSSAKDAIAKCDRPDWIVRLAFKAAKDRKAVISRGSHAARRLTRTKYRGPTELFVPWPHALEAVNVWAQGEGATAGSFEILRAYGVAALPATITAVLADWLVLRPRFGASFAHFAAFSVVLAVAVVLFAQVAKQTLRLVVRRTVSRLDEEAALRIVLKHIERGMVTRPDLVPDVVSTLRRKLGEILALGGHRSS